MTTSSRGSELERKAQKELEAGGWTVERARGKVLWIPAPELGPGRRRPIVKGVDFFGAFDLHAVCTSGHRFVQVCDDHRTKSASERRAAIRGVEGVFPPGDSLELWRWRGGGAKKGDRLPRGWVKERLDRATGEWLVILKE